MRLDVLIASRLPQCSRSRAARLIAAGMIGIGAQRCTKAGHRIQAGDMVSGNIPAAPEPQGPSPEAIPLQLIYADEDLAVVNKPAGMVVHPAPGHSGGTLVNALLHRFPELEQMTETGRAGIVHRLDKDTSGLVVVARSNRARELLSVQFKARTVDKQYLALVGGQMDRDHGIIALPIGRHPVDRKRMSVRSRKGREAETVWRVLRSFDAATLLRIGLHTGRTHQIRVHCAAVGHPILGDPKYGGRAARRLRAEKPELARLCRRQLLHAWRIALAHPRTGERVAFAAPLPADMRRVLKRLRADKKGA
jgi:23S rRNA pseudouridine1911/1915/1917 synthase